MHKVAETSVWLQQRKRRTRKEEGGQESKRRRGGEERWDRSLCRRKGLSAKASLRKGLSFLARRARAFFHV